MTQKTTPQRKTSKRKTSITPAVPTQQIDYSKRAISASFTVPMNILQAFYEKYPKGTASQAVAKLMKADLELV